MDTPGYPFIPRADEPDEQRLLIAYGRAMMAWNTLDGTLHTLLEIIIDEDGPAGRATVLALTADAGGMDLEKAISSLAKAVLTGERLADVLALVSFVAAIRPYRNYYAHGLNHMSRERGVLTAPVLTWTAKGGIKHQIDRVTADDLDQMAIWCATAASFTMALPSWWYPLKSPGYEPTRPVLPPKPPQLEKLTNDLDFYWRPDRGPNANKGR
ncbi:MAG: hypothetical protein V7672_00875 [Brevundimonas sp.]|uniref:hypothetical protein n=1 Tax=Brevundimonas sp. TaxID=1871086 RepID=UPI003002ED43